MQAVAELDIDHFRENVRALCSERGAQRRLAEAVKISPPYLSDVLRGLKSPSLDIAYDIARALGVGLDTLGMPRKKFLRIFKNAS